MATTHSHLQKWLRYVRLNDRINSLQNELTTAQFDFRTAEIQLINLIVQNGPLFVDNKILSVVDGKLEITENSPTKETKI